MALSTFLLLALGQAAPDAPPLAEIPDGALKIRYEAERLSIGPSSVRHWDQLAGPGVLEIPPDTAWDVYRGPHPISTAAFAQLTGDADVIVRLQREKKRASIASRVALATGGVLATLSLVPVSGLEDADRASGRTDAETERLRVSAEHRNEGRWAASGALLGSGLLVMVASAEPRKALSQRQEAVAAYYEREAAEKRILAYNQRLRKAVEPAPKPPEPPPVVPPLTATPEPP